MSKFNQTSWVVKLSEWQHTCRVLQVKSDCSSPQTLSAATTRTMTRKIKSTESQTLPTLVEWRLTPASWEYRAVQGILERQRKSSFNNAFSWVAFLSSNKRKVRSNGYIIIRQTDIQKGKDESRNRRCKQRRGWKGMKVRRRREGLEPAFMWTDEPLSLLRAPLDSLLF